MTVLKRDRDGGVSEDASLALSGFRASVAAEQRASLAEGVPYPVGDGVDGIVWVHPDGTRRATVFAAQAELGFVFDNSGSAPVLLAEKEAGRPGWLAIDAARLAMLGLHLPA